MIFDSTDALVIEDDLYIAKFFQFLLRQEGLRAEVVVNGRQALLRLKNSTPRIILLDLNLPDIHGSKILSSIRSDPRFHQTWIVVITADGQFVSSLFPRLGWTSASSNRSRRQMCAG
jgi:DNA-binding response OmpR family regulator